MYFTPATLEHVYALEDDLRPQDRDEIIASYGTDTVGAMRFSIEASDRPFSGWDEDGALICIFGAAPMTAMSDTASPWCLGTSLMRPNAGEVIRHTRSWIDWVQITYPKLVNYVDARNTASLRWLAGVGFTLDPPEPYGPAGLPFHRFHKGMD